MSSTHVARGGAADQWQRLHGSGCLMLTLCATCKLCIPEHISLAIQVVLAHIRDMQRMECHAVFATLSAAAYSGDAQSQVVPHT